MRILSNRSECTTHEIFGDAHVPVVGWADMFQAEMDAMEIEVAARRADDDAELDRQLAEMMQDDEIHCRACGCVTAGSVIAHSHVQACDACIVKFVEQQIGVLA